MDFFLAGRTMLIPRERECIKAHSRRLLSFRYQEDFATLVAAAGGSLERESPCIVDGVRGCK